MPDVPTIKPPVDRARKSRKPTPPRPSLMARVGFGRWPRRRVVLAGVLLIAATGIAVNALVLQSARHPAPLFAAVEAARRPQPAPPLPPMRRPPPETAAPPTAPVPPASVPVVPPPTDQQALARIAAGTADKARPAPAVSPAPRAAPPEKPPEARAAEAKPAVKPPAAKIDPLAEIIRGGITPPAPIPSEPDDRILQVQRGLARLGHADLKADGFLGPATKAAIEKFERERKWPVTGEVGPRLVRELGLVTASRP